MKIGVIGTGRMGGTLGRLWAAQGHKIILGSRFPDKTRNMTTGMLSNIKTVSIAEAAHFSVGVFGLQRGQGFQYNLQADQALR